jgi:hypothetical protein
VSGSPWPVRSGQRFELRDPRRMAALLADWDPRAGLPTLRELTRICRARYARPGIGHDWTTRNLAVSIAKFTLARDGAGAAGALREYADWIRTVTPDAFDSDMLTVLEPLHRRPDDPDLAAAADWLFGDPRSPWVPLIGREGSRPSYQVVALIASPMTKVPAFRSRLRTALDDRAPIGAAEVGDDGIVSVKLDAGLSMGRSGPKGLPDAPARGAKVSLRVCDFYAWLLATLEGAPAFHPCWPESRRDTAVAAMADFLAHQGSR